MTRLINDHKAVAILGEVASSLSLAGGPIAQQAKVPMISPSSTNPDVTDVGDYIFRVCFLDDFQGWVGAKFAQDNLKATKAAILYDQAEPYSSGLADFFEKSFKELGGTIVTTQAYTGGNLEISSQLQSIKGAGADVGLPAGLLLRRRHDHPQGASEAGHHGAVPRRRRLGLRGAAEDRAATRSTATTSRTTTRPRRTAPR